VLVHRRGDGDGEHTEPAHSEESALKYFLLGAFATGFLLYGIAFLYGASGTLDLPTLSEAWHQGAYQPLMLFGIGLMLIGLSFKAAFVPFHQWTPDVYQGAPTNVTAFMAAGSKIAAIGALWRVLEGTVALQQYWAPALFWIAILTMTVGNVVALVQKDVKRILGYSSIAHAGYILVAVLAHFKRPDIVSSGTVAYYLLAYALMTVGSFAVVSLGAKGGREATSMDDLNGMAQRSPLAAFTLVVLMASLIGVPPTAGFFGKLFIFGDAVAAGLAPLAIVLAVNSVISVYYYLGIARAAFVAEERREAGPLSLGVASTAVICAAGVVLAAVFFAPLTNFLNGALGGGEPPVSASLTPPGRP
jgi:NADH-quinone oxidoreductase subunit N